MLVLEPKRRPEAPSRDQRGSEWEGISGAVVVCNGLVVAVQHYHQNPRRAASLEATPLSKVCDDPDWRRHLERHGLSVEPEEVSATRLSDQGRFTLPDKPHQPRLTLPDKPDPFVGRDPVVETLVAHLTSKQSPAIALEGMPGAGITTLALALAYDQRIWEHFTDGVLWAGLGKQPNVDHQQAIWANALAEDLTPYPTAEERKQALRGAIGVRRMLLVIDDAWELAAAELLRCGGPNCRHLLTTRDQDLAREFATPEHVTKVEELTEDDAYELLAQCAPTTCHNYPEASRKLCNRLGGLPLALKLVGAYLDGSSQRFFKTEQRAGLECMTDPGKRLELSSRHLGDATSVEQNLQQAIELSLEDLDKSCRQAFFALGAFAPKPAWFDLEAAKAVTQADEPGLGMLLSRNLLEIDEQERLAIHQVLADAARAHTRAQALRHDKDAVTRHRDYYLALVNADVEDWRRIEAAYNQIKWAWHALDEDVHLVGFASALGYYQERRGLWHDRLEWSQRALPAAQAAGLQEEIGDLYNYIGLAHCELGQPRRGLRNLLEALEIRKQLNNQIDVANSLNNVGSALDDLGDFDQAIRYYRKAITIHEAQDNFVDAGIALSNIGTSYAQMGRFQQALDHYLEAFEIQEREQDPVHAATTARHIGQLLYQHLDKPEEAVTYLLRARHLQEGTGDRAGSAATLALLGIVHAALGRREQALENLEQARIMAEEAADAELCVNVLERMGDLQEDTDQALEYKIRAIEMAKKASDPEDPDKDTDNGDVRELLLRFARSLRPE